MLDDNGVPVLMDLGSTNTARVEIKTRTEAQALQVIFKIEPQGKKTGLQVSDQKQRGLCSQRK